MSVRILGLWAEEMAASGLSPLAHQRLLEAYQLGFESASKPTITVREERRTRAEPFGSLVVNDIHIYRFDNMSYGLSIAELLAKALGVDPSEIKRETL